MHISSIAGRAQRQNLDPLIARFAIEEVGGVTVVKPGPDVLARHF